MNENDSATPGTGKRRSAPIGSLGKELVRVQGRTQTIVLLVTMIAGIAAAANLLPALVPVVEPLGFAPALVLLGIVAWAIFVLAVAAMMILPPPLLPADERAVLASHSWIGAREIRRMFGRAAAATAVPTNPAAATSWLARTPATDLNRGVRVAALVMLGRSDDARAEARLLPERTPLESYRKLEHLALIDDQAGEPVDESSLRAAVAAIPPGPDRTEAAASLAVFRARRLLPDGDWRAPLREVRPMIPGSDVRILVADLALPMLEVMARRVVVPFTMLIALIAGSMIGFAWLSR